MSKKRLKSKATPHENAVFNDEIVRMRKQAPKPPCIRLLVAVQSYEVLKVGDLFLR